MKALNKKDCHSQRAIKKKRKTEANHGRDKQRDWVNEGETGEMFCGGKYEGRDENHCENDFNWIKSKPKASTVSAQALGEG